MTPMVDLGFLLVTFFMMTTQFAPTDIVAITVPNAESEMKLPESNVATILISEDGKVFFRMDGVRHQDMLGRNLNKALGLGMTEEEIERFSRMKGYGTPLSVLKGYFQLSEAEQEETLQTGIPVNGELNELGEWLKHARIANPDARMVIKADKQTPYPVVKRVMDTLQEHNINRFGLITDTDGSMAAGGA
jgi:biopolymer transport protein ExbD